MKSFYIIGSLRNDYVPKFANELEKSLPGVEAFSDWFAPGKRADDNWKNYEKARGRTYQQALGGYAARHVCEFDAHHLKRCDGAILLMPAGKSCFMELGFVVGMGKPGYILYLGEPKTRWDVMFLLATKIFFSKKELFKHLKKEN